MVIVKPSVSELKELSDVDSTLSPSDEDILEFDDTEEEFEAIDINTKISSSPDVAANTVHRSSDGKNHSDVVANNAKISYTDAADVALNTTHRSSDGTDHANVVLNDTHRGAVTGNPHNVLATQITDFDTEVSNNASVVANTAKISYTDAADVALNTTHRTSDGTDHANVVLNDAYRAVGHLPLAGGTLTNTLTIDQDTDAVGLSIDHEGTTADALDISTTITTGNGLDVVGDAVTTGSLARFLSNSAVFTGTDGLVDINVENAAASGIGLRVKNDGTGNGLFINQNGDGVALNIDSESVSNQGINLYSDAVMDGTRGLARFRMDNSSSVSPVLELLNDGTGNGLLIDQNGNGIALNIDSEATSTDVVSVSCVNTSGVPIDISNSAVHVQSLGALMRLGQNNSSSTAPALRLNNAGTGNGLLIDQNGNGIALNIDSEATTQPALVVVSGVNDGTEMFSVNHDTQSNARVAVKRKDTVNDDVFLLLGRHRLWVDSTGDLRIKSSSDPTSDTDGVVVGSQS